MLSKPISYSRIRKWALALTEYSLTYMPLKVMKGQVVTKFIIDHAIVETPQNYLELEPWKLYFDGSSHKNGPDIGILLILPSKILTKFKYNEAEYEALIVGLEILLDFRARRVEVRGDYELVIKKITKEHMCIKENLIMYFVIVNRLIKHFDYVDIQHVPRLENQEANDLAQIALGYKVSKGKLE